MPPKAASSKVEGSGTAAGLPPKPPAGAKAAVAPPNAEPTTSRTCRCPRRAGRNRFRPTEQNRLDDQTDGDGSDG